jgi:IclR family transcriptional regulator, acetate operon repressor
MAASSGSGTQAIDRAGDLLVRVVESARPLGVGELAELTGLPKSTTSRLVSALERHGLVQRAGGLRPGPVLLRLAQRGVPDAALVELADDSLRLLAETSGETINLGVPAPAGVDHLAQRDSRHFVGTTNWVGRRVPLHATSNGKVFLAFGVLPVPELLERLTPRTITQRAKLEQALEQVRARGYAVTYDELEIGLAAIAAPVRGAEGDVVAALSISGPTIRLTPERVQELAPLLVEQARVLSGRLGFPDLERGAA